MKLEAAEAKLIFGAAQRQVTILQARLDKVREQMAVSNNRYAFRSEEESLKREIDEHRSLAVILQRANELPADVELMGQAVKDLEEFAKYTRSLETSRAIEALSEKLSAEAQELSPFKKSPHPRPAGMIGSRDASPFKKSPRRQPRA